MANKWVGRGDSANKDPDVRSRWNKVICMNSMKIYHCPESASIDLDIPVLEIKGCCDGYLREFKGKVLKWYASYFEGIDNPVLCPKIEYVTVIRPRCQRDITDSRRITLHMYNSLVRYVSDRMFALIDKDMYSGEDYISCSTLITLIQKFDPEFKMQARHLSQHLTNHTVTYKRILNLSFDTEWSKSARKYILTVMFYRPDKPEIIDQWEDELSKAMSGRGLMQPIIRLEDERIFGSMTSAHDITHIRRDVIRWCCYGDIKDVQVANHPGRKWNFRFVKFIEEN